MRRKPNFYQLKIVKICQVSKKLFSKIRIHNPAYSCLISENAYPV